MGSAAAANLAAMSLQMPSGVVPGVGAGAAAVNGWKDWKAQMASPPGLLDPRAFDASRWASTPSLTPTLILHLHLATPLLDSLLALLSPFPNDRRSTPNYAYTNQ